MFGFKRSWMSQLFRCLPPVRRPQSSSLALEKLEDRLVLDGPESWTGPTIIPGWLGHDTQGAAVAVGKINQNDRPDMVVLHVDNPSGENRGYYRIGQDIDSRGNVARWTDPTPIPGGWGHATQGAGAALYDIDRNGRPELVVMHVDNPSGENRGHWRIAWNLDSVGMPTGHLRTGQAWTGPVAIPGWWGHDTQGAGIAIADTYDSRGVYSATHLYAFHIDNPQGDNQAWYRISDELSPQGGFWRSPSQIRGWIGHETQGADIAVADLNHDRVNEIITFWIDNPSGENHGYFRINGGAPVLVPGWWGHESQGAGLALTDLDGNGRPEMILLHVDNPSGDNRAYYRIGWNLGAPSPPPPAVIIDDVVVMEGDAGTTAAEFTVRLVTPGRELVTVQYSTTDGSATSGSDYLAASGSVTFEPGQTLKSITVEVNGDPVPEPDETFFVHLSNPINARILRERAVCTIENDDQAPPSLSVSDVSIVEGNLGWTDAVFTVSLSAPSSQIVTVDYYTEDGTASAADYFGPSGILTFFPGQTSHEVTISVVGDPVPEPDETFFVNLREPTNATIAGGQGTGTILNDDSIPPPPTPPAPVQPAPIPSAPSMFTGDVWVAKDNNGGREILNGTGNNRQSLHTGVGQPGRDGNRGSNRNGPGSKPPVRRGGSYGVYPDAPFELITMDDEAAWSASAPSSSAVERAP